MNLPPKSIVYKNFIELGLLSPKDAPAIFQAVQESRESLRKFMSWAHFDADLIQTCSIFADFEAKSLKGEEVNFAGFDAHSGEFLFCAGLTPDSRLNKSAFDIGYWVSSKYQNRGIGTIAAKILTVLAFRHFQADRVSIVCNPDNQASLRIINKCGFHFEGTLRNFHAKPTPEMVAQGFSAITDISSFSLISQDLPEIGWFEEVYRDLSIKMFYEFDDTP